jgi:beta-mannosidase
LVLDEWQCAGLPAGAVHHPKELDGALCAWFPAPVPGTVASALRSLGRTDEVRALDEWDWWFRCRIPGRCGRWTLELDGIATLADVWLNGEWVLHSENMHRARRALVELLEDTNELVVRCAALAPVLAMQRARPRWKSALVEHQGLRWIRASLLGRLRGWAAVPPAVGMWRPVRLVPAGCPAPVGVVLHAAVDGHDGLVRASLRAPGLQDASAARLRVGPVETHFGVRIGEEGAELSGELRVPQVDRWWPHTHGPQPLYDVWADLDGVSYRLGAVGFRTVTVDREGDRFSIAVNDQPIFCRGAVWLPPDPVALRCPDAVLDHRLSLVRTANMNMLRVPGTAVYEDRRFLERCDALGILVWHDCMFAFCDPPDDPAFTEEVVEEVTEALRAMSGHPSIALLCGNQEVQEIAAMSGLAPETTALPLFDEVLPGLAARVLPGVPYVSSNPVGGGLPFRMSRGVSQYFGVGGYFRPVEDVRLAGVQFAAECLAYSTPPEPETVEEACGGAHRAGHDPEWKRGVHHDAGCSWDMEDVRDFYVQTVFGVDPLTERRRSPERALELGRAANAHLMAAVMSEWRRPGSGCGGGLVLAFGDLRAGAGWGVVDALGRPKAPWYVLRRLFQPVALIVVDEGLNGIALHVVNDTAEPVLGRLDLSLVSGDAVVDEGSTHVRVPPRGSASFDAESVLGGFRDVGYAYRFSAPSHDALVATLRAGDGPTLSQAVHFTSGTEVPLERDVGLSAVAQRVADDRWDLELRAERLAQWVTVRAPGFEVEDSWFHLAPSTSRTVGLRSMGCARPRGFVSALNARTRAPIRLAT